MEKQTIFRKVSVHDRLPKEEGIYVVKNSQGWFEAIFDNNYLFHGEFTDCSGVTHWLEEVTINTIIQPSRRGNIPTKEYCDGYINGANYILNLLK